MRLFKDLLQHILCSCRRVVNYSNSCGEDGTYLGGLVFQEVQQLLVVLEARPETLLLFPCLLSHPRLPSDPAPLEALRCVGLM